MSTRKSILDEADLLINADRIAIKTLGVHPGVIWPNHWFKEDN